jgi:DNA processing protein
MMWMIYRLFLCNFMEKHIHAFNLLQCIGYISLQKISKRFKSFQYAWEKASPGDFEAAGLNREQAEGIADLRGRINVDEEYEKLRDKDIYVIVPDSAEYPELLRQIPNPPFLFYRRGAPLNPADKFIAMVGTRVPSLYGEKMAFAIAERISLCGGIVVSGLAFGVDAICHRAAVKNNKPTVAVMASPVDNVTPSSHFNLAEKILATGGTIISEYAGDTASYKYRFLERNRIISGLCKATIVIEAAKKSGALITAAHANEQQRDVYALVGDIIRPQAQGCLGLIDASKAWPIVSMESLLYDLGFDPPANKHAGLNKEELFIAEKLTFAPLSTDELCAATGFGSQILNVILTKLEIKKLIRKNQNLKWEPV